MSGNFMLVVLVIVFVHGSDAAIENSPADVSVVYGGNVTILWKVGNPSNIITLTWSFVASNGTETILMDRTLNNAPTPKPGCNCAFNNAENGGITVLNVNKFGRYKIAVVYTNESPDEDEVLFNEILGTAISSKSTSIPITSQTSATTTHLVTPSTTSSTSTSTTTTATGSIATSSTTTTSIKTSTRTTNSAVSTRIVTQSEQDGSKTIVIFVPTVVGGLFIIGVGVTVALVIKFRSNKTLHNNRSNHHKEGPSKKENKVRHLKHHPEYSEYIPTHHHGFSAKELYGYKMYSGQIEIKRNPLYSHNLARHMNMLLVTNRGQYHYDQLYNGNQFLGYQMPSARADGLYTRRGHMIHPQHRYQYSTNPRATTLRTQDNTIVTDYSWNWK